MARTVIVNFRSKRGQPLISGGVIKGFAQKLSIDDSGLTNDPKPIARVVKCGIMALQPNLIRLTENRIVDVGEIVSVEYEPKKTETDESSLFIRFRGNGFFMADGEAADKLWDDYQSRVDLVTSEPIR